MEPNSHQSAQPLRELEWLAHYFREHSREDLAQDIFEQIQHLRHLAQDSLSDNTCEIISLEDVRLKAEGLE